MNYFKLAALSIVDKLKINIIFILQLTMLFFLINIIVGSINSRDMLYKPYKSLLKKQGWYLSYIDFDKSGKDIQDLFEKSEIKPEIFSIYETYGYDANSDYYQIAILPDHLFSELSFPTVQSVASSGKTIYAFSGRNTINAGDSINLIIGDISIRDIVVTNLLTDPTYYPTYSKWNLDGDITMLYKQLSSETEKDNYLIMSSSTAQELKMSKDLLVKTNNSIVVFPNNTNSELLNSEEQRILDLGNVGIVPLSQIRERTENLLNYDYNRYIPLGLITIIVVMIGTAGAIAIQTLKEMKNYAVLYLCGMKWQRIIIISLCKVFIMLVVAFLISSSSMIIMQSTSIAARLGLYFNKTNLYISLALVGLILLSSLALPFILMRRSEPADLMRRIKND